MQLQLQLRPGRGGPEADKYDRSTHLIRQPGGIGNTPIADLHPERIMLSPNAIAARMDRLPSARIHWWPCLLVQMAYGLTTAAGAYVPFLYIFVWSKDFGHLQYAWLSAVQLGLGVVVGELAGGHLADRFGRKKTIVWGSLLAGLGTLVGGTVAPNYVGLLMATFVQAIGIGFVCVVSAVYMNEFVPPDVRGRITSGAQATTGLWAVLALAAAHYLVPEHYRTYIWGLGVAAIVAACALLAAPESPRWLAAKGRWTEANQVVERIERAVQRQRGQLPEPDLREANPPVLPITEQVTLGELFRGESLRRTLVVTPAWILGYSGIIFGCEAFMAVHMQSYGFAAPQFFLVTILIYGPGYAAGALLASLVNERVERRTLVCLSAGIFSGALLLIWVFSHVHQIDALLWVGWALVGTGSGLWLYSMYNYTAGAYPTRLRARAMGLADGVGRTGAIFGPVIVVVLGDATAEHGFYGFMLYCAVVGALVPGLLVGFLGIRQQGASLESLSD
ncbi:MFS transporter [Mycobacterium aquaticum]|uniref:Major facilitator superfamily (MFS) profile domain-containing protein n=1 Tax=Mycobacterium aquaticum TaxID=1927124 RepID=A0A1W9ZYN0_9MYCO|nr:MFS transporter [Mycobacterium aquaticum]ORA22913.1 hypothetical protein BST13_35860 [Mycobacterium aquaticum]